MNLLEQKELDEKLLEMVRESSKRVPGVNRITACNYLKEKYGLSISQANEYTRKFGDLIAKEKGIKDFNNVEIDPRD